MAAGQRPISNVVDITNYVMLLTGQPLHAFDLDRIAGHELTVRTARDGETMETLDGQTRTLDSEMVLIADADGPTSIAGVMGGARSEVQDSTTRVLMEVANWDGANIHKTSLKLGLRSEASGRNEKGLQPEQAMQAQAIATRLMVELCGATVLPGTIDVGGDGPAAQDDRAARRARERAARHRRSRASAAPRSSTRSSSRPPRPTTASTSPCRPSVAPTSPARPTSSRRWRASARSRTCRRRCPRATAPRGRLTDVQRLRRRAADALTAQGLHEIVGWSFEGPEQVARLRIADRPAVELENPMSSDQSRLRTTLLGSLLDVGQRNRSRGAVALRLFEAGAVYLPDAATTAAARRALPRRGAAVRSRSGRPRGAIPTPRGRRLLRRQGRPGGPCSTRVRVPWSLEADAERGAVPASGAGRAYRHRRRRRRLDRRDPSPGRRRLGLV